ncbi:MAG TPA: AI-2E family transporter, partial [Dongiaceae bacterium]|nr:AI-2E family transporter [Dongiaceae bacterium]
IYEQHARDLYQHVAAFLNAHSIDITSLSATKESTSNQILKFADLLLPEVSSLFSNGLVVVLLGALILLIIAEERQRTNVRSILTQVQNDVARYVGALATTGVVAALANFILMFILGVDFPLVWAVLYFFLNFVPSIGFFLALVPPSFLTLLTLGWKRALLVVGGLVLTQLLANSAIKPIFLRKQGIGVSAVEKMLSLLWWGFLLGPVGGILAIPLTLALKRFIPDFSIEGSPAAPPPV